MYLLAVVTGDHDFIYRVASCSDAREKHVVLVLHIDSQDFM